MRGFTLTSLIACMTAMGVLISYGQAEEATPAPFKLATPDVVMEADPPPPFTYWAPENSTIRNHPRVEGIWIAETDGQGRTHYFGDQCHASRFQQFVGKALDALPEKPSDAKWRLACDKCAVHSDLGRARLNVFYDESSKVISSISCG